MSLLCKLQRDYEEMQKIGEGGFAKVLSGKDRKTGEITALKIMPLYHRKLRNLLKREEKLLKSLNHPNIISYKGTKKYSGKEGKFGALLLEKMDVDLLNFIQLKKSLTEMEVKVIFRQICEGVAHCHEHQIAHLDLKVENVLLKFIVKEKRKVIEKIQICDFGYAKKWKKNHKLDREDRFVKIKQGKIGTSEYRAPELNAIAASDKPSFIALDKADVWSLGIILFSMITGYFPFGYVDNVKVTSIDLRAVNQFTADKKCYHLVCKLLDEDPLNRPNLDDILEDPFFN